MLGKLAWDRNIVVMLICKMYVKEFLTNRLQSLTLNL